MKKTELIQKYLDDTNYLYRVWYKKELALEFGLDDDVEYKGSIPSIDEIKKKFIEWYDVNKEKLRNIICKDFEYLKKKNTYKSLSDLIIALVDVIEDSYSLPVEITIILVENGLDDICLE